MAKAGHEHSQRFSRYDAVRERGDVDSNEGQADQAAATGSVEARGEAVAASAKRSDPKEAGRVAESTVADLRNPRDETERMEPVRKQRVWAGDCPNPKVTDKKHTATRVYSTQGRTRYCVCDQCGYTWKQIGPESDNESA